MIFNMVGGGGAGGASIFIINSANERPTNVFNNTLWVNTDVDVVKYVFSDNEPSSPTEGMLWLTISDSDNINVAAPINKDWMKFNLGIVRQYIGGAWERKPAQLYKDGIWVDVSRLFAAYIDITYPANSNCVVTNSIGQTVASNTNSTSSPKTFTAIVDATGTYTVTVTDSADPTKTKSQSAEIAAEGQSVSVTLSYDLVLFDNGTVGVPISLGYKNYPGNSVTIGDVIAINAAINDSAIPSHASAVTDEKIDISDYSTLYVSTTYRKVTDGTYGAVWLLVGENRTASVYNYGTPPPGWTACASIDELGVTSLDISSLTGEYYIGLGCAYAAAADFDKWWLE